MKAITLQQPWADLVARGIKTIETRTWSPRCRGLIAIHAARRVDRRHIHKLPESAQRTRCIVAVAELVEVRKLTRADEPAACCRCAGKRGLILANVRKLPRPVPCPGALSMWTVPLEVAGEVVRQVDGKAGG